METADLGSPRLRRISMPIHSLEHRSTSALALLRSLASCADRSAAAMSWRCGELRATRCAEFLSLPGKSGARSGQQSRFSSGSSHGHTFPHRVGSDRAPRSDSSPAGHRLSASNNQRPKATATSAPISGHQAARGEGPCHPSQAG